MSHEDKYDYYKVKPEYVKSLFDDYLVLQKVINKDLKETEKLIGANGTVKTTSIGRTRITGFTFSKDCKFDFKFSSQKLEDDLIIKPYKNSKLGKEFSQKMASEIKRLDETYKWKVVIGDWLIDKFDCYRESFIGYNFLSSWAGADSKKQLIVFKIPKTDKLFNPPKEFEKITYGKLYDLVNS